jgi:hypothetical protein
VAPGLSELRRAGERSPWRWWNAGRANRGRPACASFPCIPYCPSCLTAFSDPESPSPPLLYLSLFLSLVPFFPSLDLSLSHSVLLAPANSLTRIHRAHSASLYAFGIHLVPLLSLPRLVYVLHIRMTHIYHKRKFFLLSFSLSLCFFFLSFSDSFLCLPHWHTREFASLSLSFSPFTPLLFASQFFISLVYVCAYTLTHDSLSLSLFLYLFLSLSFSLSLASKSLREHPYAFLGIEPLGPTLFCSSISFCFSSKLF